MALQDIMLEKILDEAGRKILLSEFSKIMQQVVNLVKGFRFNGLRNMFVYIYSIFCRDSLICQQEFVFPAWAGPSRMNKPLHGRFLTRMMPITA